MWNSPERGAAGSGRRPARDWEKGGSTSRITREAEPRGGCGGRLVVPILGLYAELYAAALYDRGVN